MKSFEIDHACVSALNGRMRFLLVVGVSSAVLLSGCAGRKPEPVEYKNVPGPSQTAAALPGQIQSSAEAPVEKPQPSPGEKSKDKEIVTPDSSLRGKVATFNEAGRFVILQFPLGHLPANGQTVFIYRKDLKVGEVKVTGPQRDDRTVGDLVTGEAQKGDDVRGK